MKACIKCQNELPDSAVHCVFCGAKQPQADKPKAPPGKTMMGYPGMAADMLKNVQQAQGGQSAPAGGSPPSAQQAPAPAAPHPALDPYPLAAAPIDHVDPEPPRYQPPGPARRVGPHQGPGSGPYQAPPAHAKSTVAVQPGQAAPLGAPPPAVHSAGPIGATVAVPPGASFGPPPGASPMGSPYGAPAPGMAPVMGGQPAMRPYGAPPQGQPYGAPAQGMAPGMGGPPAMQPYGAPPQGMGGPPIMGGGVAGAWDQVQAKRPPYLASETDSRMNAPFEPWSHSLKTLLLVFGVLLIACFVAPWKVAGGTTVFSWTGFKGGTFAGIAPALTLGVGGACAIVLAMVPMSAAARGALAALVGFAGTFLITLYGFFTGLGSGFAVRPFLMLMLTLVGFVTLVPGLLLRAEYRSALLPRILVTIGVICFLVPYLLPENDSLPLVALLKSIGATPGRGKILVILNVALVAVVVTSLIAWLPGPSGALGNILAWLLILWPILLSGAGGGLVPLLILGSGMGAALKGGLDVYFYFPIAAASWMALTGYGLASVCGKKLER